MNAISPRPPENADARTARHVSMCAELAELAMQLARDAAARALAAQPEEAPTPSTHEPEPAGAPRAPARKAPSGKSTDPALLFIRCAAVVKYCIALEIRLTAGGTSATHRAAAATTPARTTDPRRTILRETFRHLTARNPAQAAQLPEINACLDEHLEADPSQTLTLPEIFTTICEDLALEIDFATLPDKYLDLLCEPPDPQADFPA